MALEYNIDNVCTHKRVGLREITYVTGWYNISASIGNNVFFTRPSNVGATTNVTVPDGYYNVDTLKDVVSAAMPGFNATINHATGRVTLTLTDVNYQLDLGSTAAIWGFTALGWIGAGSYVGTSPPGFFNNRNLFVHLDQINTTGSVLNGRQSTLLRIIPTCGESYGESRTVFFEKPQFRRLRDGSIQELTMRILDASGTDISTSAQPFSVTLEVGDKH